VSENCKTTVKLQPEKIDTHLSRVLPLDGVAAIMLRRLESTKEIVETTTIGIM